MKIVIYPLLVLFGLILFVTYTTFPSSEEMKLRMKVVKLSSSNGMCSGEQVEAPSGATYILSAAHCRGLEDKNSMITVTNEAGDALQRRVIAEDPNSDLLLIEGLPGVAGLKVAKERVFNEHVRTFTHGSNLATHKSEGFLVQDTQISVPFSVITSDADSITCLSQPKNKVYTNILSKMCFVEVEETVTTAFLTPGSSGGMVVNDSGELVGVASATRPPFGLSVRLQDIRKFLAAY